MVMQSTGRRFSRNGLVVAALWLATTAHAQERSSPADPAERADVQGVDIEGAEVWVAASPSDAQKCIRCWHHRDDVGSHPDHPEICGRCVSNVEGPGEVRQWF